MNITYTASATVYADQKTVSNFFQQADVSKEYFPEVKKDISPLGEYVQATHANPTLAFPDYMVANGFGWTAGAGIQIRIPRKEFAANITALDVEYTPQGYKTHIKIAVTFNAQFNSALPFVVRCMQAMVKAKLNAFQRDIKTDYGTSLEPSFA